MEVIRLKIKQNKANYKKPESDINKMTYPLPPFSTIIGAIHNACSYNSYNPMDISVQGFYESMGKEIYYDHLLLNSTQDDRGILIKTNSPNTISAGYREVANALKPQGNSFLKDKTISIKDKLYFDEYISLKKKQSELALYNKNTLKITNKEIKEKIKINKYELKKIDKNDEKYIELDKEIKLLEGSLKDLNSSYKLENDRNKDSLSYFGTLVKSMKYYEVLYNVNLVIHISSDKETLNDIENNINNFVCLGRSEDFIDLIEIKRVKLTNKINKEIVNSKYTSYIANDLLEKDILLFDSKIKNKGMPVRGTTHLINKDYKIEDNKRIFNKVKVSAVSNFFIDEESEGVYIDEDEYIVNLN